MSSFWPSGLDIGDMNSPLEILANAKEEWEISSNGTLSLVLQEAKSQQGNSLIIVHAKHIPSNRTATLFSIVHRLSHPYPAAIQTREENLPNVLKRSYYKPGPTDIMNSFAGMGGTSVENKWVSDTPKEFREKLIEAFNLSYVKVTTLNLSTTNTEESSEEGENASESEGDET